MALTYTTWLAGAANLLRTTTTQANFVIEAPLAIDYAEGRIFRDFNLISTITRDATVTTAPGTRNINPPPAFVTITGINIITPAGTAPDNGSRSRLTKCSDAVLDALWPSNLNAGIPQKFCILAQQGVLPQPLVLLGPWPDQGYVVEIIGTQRPAPLSVSNPSTFLTQTMADLFTAATMIHFTGYQKNYGAQADDPKSAMSWENQYKLLSAGVDAEEMRKRYAGTVPGVMLPPAPPSPPQAPAAA